MNAYAEKFRARKDPAGALLVLVIFAVGGFLLFRGDLIPWPMVDKFGWLFILFGVLAAWDWLATSYEIGHDELVVRSGLGRTRVALCNIEAVRPRGKAVRLKCQKLRGSKWHTLLPVEHAAFVDRLHGKCPWLGKNYNQA